MFSFEVVSDEGERTPRQSIEKAHEFNIVANIF